MMKAETEKIVTAGKFHIDGKGGGRIYLKKKITDILLEIGFEHGEDVRVEVDKKNKIIIISKL